MRIVVFTGGQSLYEAKRAPASRTFIRFRAASTSPTSPGPAPVTADPADQAPIPHPRLGFFGVIDERMDLALLAGVASRSVRTGTSSCSARS